MSGLNQYIANVPYAKVYRGFESLPLRHTYILLHPTTFQKSLPGRVYLLGFRVSRVIFTGILVFSLSDDW